MMRDGEYKKFILTPRIDQCKMMKDLDKPKNRFTKLMIDIMKEATPTLFQKCPYVGRTDIVNMRIPSNLISFLPHTKYKFSLYFYVPFYKTNVTVSIFLEIVD